MSDALPVTETVVVEVLVPAAPEAVWAAYADVGRRVRWGVPPGEALVVDEDDLRPGGRTAGRCGTPGVLEYATSGTYVEVRPPRLLVMTEIVRSADAILSTAQLTWTFASEEHGTRVRVVDQLVSFVGTGMVDGHRNGHRITLAQLAAHFGPVTTAG